MFGFILKYIRCNQYMHIVISDYPKLDHSEKIPWRLYQSITSIEKQHMLLNHYWHTITSLSLCCSVWSVISSLVFFLPYSCSIYNTAVCDQYYHTLHVIYNQVKHKCFCICLSSCIIPQSKGKESRSVCLLLSLFAQCQLHLIFQVSTKDLIVSLDDPSEHLQANLHYLQESLHNDFIAESHNGHFSISGILEAMLL